MNKLVTLVLIATVLTAAVLIISGNLNNRGTTATQSPVSTKQGSGPKTNTDSTSVLPPTGRMSPSERDAVASAVLANASLSSAQLLPPGQLHSVLSRQVVAANRRSTEKVYRSIGPELARLWGYQSVSEARVRAGYYVTTQKYKILRSGKYRASIELYNFTHFRTSLDWDRDQEHWDATLTIVDLKRQGGKWLFADAHDPPASEMPTPETGLTFAQTKARLQPYLRGFHDYASLG